MGEGKRTVVPIYTLQIRDMVRPRAMLHCVCTVCRQRAELDPVELLAKVGPNARLRDLDDRLTCRACGAKAAASVRVEWIE